MKGRRPAAQRTLADEVGNGKLDEEVVVAYRAVTSKSERRSPQGRPPEHRHRYESSGALLPRFADE
jgi:hypothetical protein